MRNDLKSTVIYCLMLLFSYSCAAPNAFSQSVRENFDLEENYKKTFEFSKNGFFTLENHNGDIDIESWSKDEIEVEITLRYPDKEYKIEIEISGDSKRLRVRARHPEWNRNWNWFGDGQRPEAHFTVKVPKDVELEVGSHNGNITVSTINGAVQTNAHNGRIELRGINGDVDVDTHNGDIMVESVVGDVSIDTHNSEMELTDIDGSIETSAHNGNVRMRNVKGRSISTEAHNGNVTADFTPDKSGRYDFTSFNGRLDIRIPGSTGADVEVRSNRRNFDSDFDALNDAMRDWDRNRERWENEIRIREEINGGGARISLSSHHGSIKLRSK